MQQQKPETDIRSRLGRAKRTMTDKQKAARLANLERGRRKRLDELKQKNETKPTEEYDLSSVSNSSTDSESEGFVISKRKKKEPRVKSATKSERHRPPVLARDDLRNDVDDLKYAVIELAKLQKKQNKTRKQTKRSSGGTKIVVLPQGTAQPNSPNDGLMEALRRSLM